MDSNEENKNGTEGKEGVTATKPAELSPSQQEAITKTTQSVIETAKKENFGFGTHTEVSTPKDENDYKAMFENVTSDPYIKVMLDYKQTGKDIGELFKEVKIENPVDYDSIHAKDLFPKLLNDNKRLTPDEKAVEQKRFEGLSPLQQEKEVEAYREKLKAQSPSTVIPDIFKTAKDIAEKELPGKRQSEQQQQRIEKEYKDTVANNLVSLKNIEGKELPKDQKEAIWSLALRISDRSKLTPEAAKANLEMAQQMVCRDEYFTAAVAYGAKVALQQYINPDANRGTATAASSLQNDKKSIVPLDKQKTKRNINEPINA